MLQFFIEDVFSISNANPGLTICQWKFHSGILNGYSPFIKNLFIIRSTTLRREIELKWPKLQRKLDFLREKLKTMQHFKQWLKKFDFVTTNIALPYVFNKPN